MKKKYLILFLCCVTLGGCAPTEAVVENSEVSTGTSEYEKVLASLDEELIENLPQTIECTVNDKLIVDAEINTWDADGYLIKSGKGKLINFSEDEDKSYELMNQLAELINLNEDDCEQSYRFENDDNIYDWENRSTHDWVQVRKKWAIAVTHDGGIALSASEFGENYLPFNDKEKFKTNKELSFMPIEEAKEMAIDTVNEFEIEVCNRCEIYTLDESNTLLFPESDTDKQIDTYAFFLFPSVNGIPYSRCPENEILTGYINQENHLQVAINENGISYFSIPPLYDWVETTETKEILHPSTILSKEVDKLKQYLTAGDIEVKEISLEYMPFADENEMYNIKPVWMIYYYQNQLVQGEISYEQRVALYDVYDAYTGEEYRIQ